jgi:membrane fusion protein, multidrug efflux system
MPFGRFSSLFGCVFVAGSVVFAPSLVKAQSSPSSQERVVSVVTGQAKVGALPVIYDTVGNVQPVSSVTLRPRVEAQVVEVNFADGAVVHAGDVLVRLDQRLIEAQVRQAEATVARTSAQLEQAQRDVARNEALAANEFASKVNLENSKTQVAALTAQLAADRAALDSLRVQLSYYTIISPVDGRVGVAGLKVGNIAKTGDGSVPFAVINQIAPIYVAFNVPQQLLPDLRAAVNDPKSKVQALAQGSTNGVTGRISVIDNAVDLASGTVTVRATFENKNEELWPGALCNVRVTLKVKDNAISVPREAVRTNQKGSFVFTVENGVAHVVPVKLGQMADGRTEIVDGLKGTETVVVDGQIQLVDGVKVDAKAAAGAQ